MVENVRVDAPTNGFHEHVVDEPPRGEAPYALLTGAFGLLLALAASGGGEGSQTRFTLFDVACAGLASDDIARIVARDRIAMWLRKPFAGGPAAQHPRGAGARRAVGELLTCPHCLSVWVAAALAGGILHAPRQTRLVAAVFAAHAVAAAADRRLSR